MRIWSRLRAGVAPVANGLNFVTAEGKSTFVKFHWKPKLGMQSVGVG